MILTASRGNVQIRSSLNAVGRPGLIHRPIWNIMGGIVNHSGEFVKTLIYYKASLVPLMNTSKI